MVRIGFAIAFLLLVDFISAEDAQLVQSATPIGKWQLQSVELGGEDVKSDMQAEWEFAGDRVTTSVDGKIIQVAKVQVRRNRSSMEIDFVPSGKNMESAYVLFPVLTKGLYLVQNDELKIALTFGGSVAETKEEERRRAIPAKGIRPPDFNTKRGDVWVFTFKRKD